jgi:hypothetical protein
VDHDIITLWDWFRKRKVLSLVNDLRSAKFNIILLVERHLHDLALYIKAEAADFTGGLLQGISWHG